MLSDPNYVNKHMTKYTSPSASPHIPFTYHSKTLNLNDVEFLGHDEEHMDSDKEEADDARETADKAINECVPSQIGLKLMKLIKDG